MRGLLISITVHCRNCKAIRSVLYILPRLILQIPAHDLIVRSNGFAAL